MDDGRPPVGHLADSLLDVDLAKLGDGTTDRPVLEEPNSGPREVAGRHLGTDTELALVEGELLTGGHLRRGRVLFDDCQSEDDSNLQSHEH